LERPDRKTRDYPSVFGLKRSASAHLTFELLLVRSIWVVPTFVDAGVQGSRVGRERVVDVPFTQAALVKRDNESAIVVHSAVRGMEFGSYCPRDCDRESDQQVNT
jgi:hypothetical protein